MSPCWAGFDIQTMRQGSTQGGRLPCNINSHLESSCGCGHETLKETAAMDPVPLHHHSHCLLQLPPHCSPKPAWKRHKPALIPLLVSRLRCRQHLGEGKCFQGRRAPAFSSSLCGNDRAEDKEMSYDCCKVQQSSPKMATKTGLVKPVLEAVWLGFHKGSWDSRSEQVSAWLDRKPCWIVGLAGLG